MTDFKDKLMGASHGEGIHFCPFCKSNFEPTEGVNVWDVRNSLGIIYYVFECCNISLTRLTRSDAEI